MYLSGFADEASSGIEGQVAATRDLGWSHIEVRTVDGTNVHDLSDEAFESMRRKLDEAGIRVNCLGSNIANWGADIDTPFERTLEQLERSIERMRILEVPYVRIMSYKVREDEHGRALDDQKEEERIRRLNEVCRRFADAGMTALHENCHTWGGMSIGHTLRLLERVPDIRLVFDTGNPPLTPDFSRPFPYPRQDSWDFYRQVKDAVVHVHVKDTRFDASTGKEIYLYPGEGDGDVARIVTDLLGSGYDGGFSIEPHMAVVYHDASVTSSEEAKYRTYVEYGRRFEAMLNDIRKKTGR